MAGIIIYDVTMKFLTPAMITVEEGSRGMLYEGFSDRIPGSTVRGSLLSWALREGLVTINEVTKEVLAPRYAVTPFLLSARDDGIIYEDVGIAHALSFKFKDGMGDERVYSFGIKDLVEEIRGGSGDPVTALQMLIARTSESIDRRGDDLKSSTNLERVLGASITRDPRGRGGWRLSRGSAKSGSYVGISIDRERGSVMPGALFLYEYVESGSTYVGAVACEEGSLVCKLLDGVRRGAAKVLVGKGTGRGYGVAEVRVRERGESPDSGINDLRGCGYLAFEVIGPLLTFTPRHQGDAPLPRPAGPGDRLLVSLGHSTLSIDVVAAFGNVGRFGGWSLRTNSPKLAFNALSYGSIIVGRVEGDSKLLGLMPYLGLDKLSSQGYNILLPLMEDFLPKFGGEGS